MVLSADRHVWDARELLQPLATAVCPPVSLHRPKWCFSGVPDVHKLILLLTKVYQPADVVYPAQSHQPNRNFFPASSAVLT